MLELASVAVDTVSRYSTVTDIPNEQCRFLALYSAIYDMDGLPNLATAEAMLDDLVGNTCFTIEDTSATQNPVGAMSYYHQTADTLFLDGLVVTRAMRSARIVGPFAMSAMVNYAQAASVETIRLESKLGAVPFYERHGFTVDTRGEYLVSMSRKV